MSDGPHRAAAMPLWITDYNSNRPHSALSGRPPLTCLAAPRAQTMTTSTDTSDTEPGFVGMAGVKPREATAKGGLGLTLVASAQAQSLIGGDNVLGNDT
ncbi:integrase core domain-containing protein [Rhodopila sp.]|uniref:integrase core domain-containing protein n=1 Tax=Rhodopila sp. TaxID=2480087 RepID=UPI003D10996E